MLKKDQAKLCVLVVFVAGCAAYLFTDNFAARRALAYSSGPPAGHTGAPSEFTCAECHVNSDGGAGRFIVNAPTRYTPGQTYQITVSHSTSDQTRKRWGFQLTALADDNTQAGTLQSADAFTQVLNNQGPGNSRQYVEHTSSGTYFNQLNNASWTFNWTAPSADVGPVTFYAAGNQANGDGNTSGDFIYTTFVAATFAAAAGDFSINSNAASAVVAPGNSAAFNLSMAPSAGFNGQVALSASGLPSGVNATFNPASVSFNDASAKASTLTLTTSAATPLGNYPITITASGASVQHTINLTLKVASATSADLSVGITGSPNPVTAGTNLSYRITVNDNGPAAATNVQVIDTLPVGANFVSATATQGACGGAGTVMCNLGNLMSGGSIVVTLVVSPTAAGSINNSVSASASEIDPDATNNSASVSTHVDPQAVVPSMLDAKLGVRTFVGGLNQPISMAFVNANELLVLEKATGKVQHVVNGQLQNTSLDLAVNNASERGLLGIALHPNFASNHFVYLYWTESTTGADSSNLSETPLLGNRVDRYLWDGSTLAFDRNLIHLRAYQADANQPLRGNHNGGVVRFGPDGKLYLIIGDNGRRGQLQNLPSGPTDTGLGATVADDQYGGPQPDNAHFTGTIIRLNDDGTTPTDNPFFNAGAQMGGEAGANIQKIFAYGVRNSFGMSFDPVSGNLWTEENGDDSYDEINRVNAGFNGGWVQAMGPLSRLADYKAIEVSRPGGLQQDRWPAERIADTPAEALSRLFMLPGAHYTDPEFSWRYAVAPSPVGFVVGNGLGAQYAGDLFVGASRTTLVGGYLFDLKLTSDRQHIATSDPRLADKVADNLDKFDLTESESLLIGRDFGVTTDIQTGPNGNVFVVSLSNGAIYEIFAQPTVQFSATNFNAGEGDGHATITITRTGDATHSASVDYETVDNTAAVRCDDTQTMPGIAFARCDYATTVDTLTFAPGETRKTFDVPIIDDAYVEGNETVPLRLSNPAGATLGTVSAATLTIIDNDTAPTSLNPIDSSPFFVRQQYLDFLSREPDTDGYNSWLNLLNNCPNVNGDPNCDRNAVSSSFFRSQEFQLKGSFVYRFYKVSFGRLPTYLEIIPDMRKVTGQTATEVYAKRQAFTNTWVLRSDFRAMYDALNDAAYVDALLNRYNLTSLTTIDPGNPDGAALVVLTKTDLVNRLAAQTLTRAQVLRAVAESQQVDVAEYNSAFVAMQYFGYLRRDPDADGYNNWLTYLNAHPSNFRTMVNGFMNSVEYRLRFGQP